ncbi:MAG: GFA family protein [Gammaproteobacteria bacterium]|nr:hypothetical protein [Chromatiales bacterium]MDP6673527.1 GFA family protein [Gammaproteobacteria bacterium]
MKSFSGSCLCKQIKFRCETPSLWCAHCHCSLCRRAHGAAFVTWVGVDEGNFTLLSEDTLRWYKSSPDSERGFCATCGSTLFFRSARWPEQMHIVRANINTEIDLEPSAHVYWDTHVDWVDFVDPPTLQIK